MAIPKYNKGLQAYTSGGGKATIANYHDSVGGGASNLTQAEMDAFQKARLVASPKNGGDWLKAKAMLEEAGFEVFWR